MGLTPCIRRGLLIQQIWTTPSRGMVAAQRRQKYGTQANCGGGILPLGLSFDIRRDLLIHQSGTTPSQGMVAGQIGRN